MKPKLVVVVGPTGAGKSALAVHLAQAVGGEVISCDSQQVYRGMDIGTGKIATSARQGVPHHLLDILEPDQEMTAARFIELADQAIVEVAARGHVPIICGGTGLYVRALLLGLFEGPPADPVLRARLYAELADEGEAVVHARLAAVDPVLAAKIDAHDHKRLVRALEVFELTGEPMSQHQARHNHREVQARYLAHMVGVAPARETLYARINQRVDEMLGQGLLEEVATLRARAFVPPLRSQQAIGYGELHAVLAGESQLPAAVDLIKRNSRHYARRQLTWYRNDATVHWHEEPASVDVGVIQRYLISSHHG